MGTAFYLDTFYYNNNGHYSKLDIDNVTRQGLIDYDSALADLVSDFFVCDNDFVDRCDWIQDGRNMI